MRSPVTLDDSLDLTPAEPSAGVPAGPAGEFRTLPLSGRRTYRRSLVDLGLPTARTVGYLGLVVVLWLMARTYLPRDLDVVAADAERILTADMVLPLSGDTVDPSAAVLAKRRPFGGGFELLYDYQPAGLRVPGMRVRARAFDDEADAAEAFLRSTVTTMLDWDLAKSEEVGLVELDEGDPWGDESRVYRVVLGPRVLGYSVAVREGAATLYAKLENVELRSEHELRWLVAQVMTRLGTEPDRPPQSP
jgi:hypothetical protein